MLELMEMNNKKIIGLLIALFVIMFAVPKVNAATISLITDKDTYKIGDTFDINVKIDSENQGINGAQANIKFDNTIFEVTKTDKSDSIFDFWLTNPTITVGQVNFIAAATTGFNGKSLQVVKITFKVKAAGQSDITITDAAITASDGSGSNVLSKSLNVGLTALAQSGKSSSTINQITRTAQIVSSLPVKPTLSIPLYTDSTKWYNVVSNFLVSWNLPIDVSDVSTAINKDPNFNPITSEGLFASKNFQFLSDGVWYLHVRFKNNNGWGPAVHYKIGIDTAPPAAFKIQVAEGLSTNNPTPHITYVSGDGLSGIDYYSILIDKNNPIITNDSSYTLPAQSAGKHLVRISVYDKSGNSAVNFVTVHITEIPILTFAGISVTQSGLFIFIIIILLLSFVIGWYMFKMWREQIERKVIIAQRDVVNVFAIANKDLDKVLKNYDDGVITDHEADEIEFILKKIKMDIEKAKKYILDNINEINK